MNPSTDASIFSRETRQTHWNILAWFKTSKQSRLTLIEKVWFSGKAGFLDLFASNFDSETLWNHRNVFYLCLKKEFKVKPRLTLYKGKM